MNKLRNVELIRANVVRNLEATLLRIKVYVSSTADNQDAVDSLAGSGRPVNEELLAHMVDIVLEQMGHKTTLDASKPNSRSRRVVNGSRV